MSARQILVAGIGNIFQGDDAFGVAVVSKLAEIPPLPNVRLMDVGIRSIDLGFALLDDHDLTILVDATKRGGPPGTLYTIEIRPADIPDMTDAGTIGNSHSLDPVRVLSLAKGMGARFRKVFLVGCEPLVTEHDESGFIGISQIVAASIPAAVQTVIELIEDLQNSLTIEEVYIHESA